MVDIYYIIKSMQLKVTNSYAIVKFWLPVILWAGVIFTFSSQPTIQTTDFFLGDFILKKTAHLVEYAILSALIFRAMINYGVDRKKAFIYSLIIAGAYGISDEFHQSFTPGREPRLRDIIIDTIGATAGVISCRKKF